MVVVVVVVEVLDAKARLLHRRHNSRHENYSPDLHPDFESMAGCFLDLENCSHREGVHRVPFVAKGQHLEKADLVSTA
jgi:hypothetical protein